MGYSFINLRDWMEIFNGILMRWFFWSSSLGSALKWANLSLTRIKTIARGAIKKTKKIKKLVVIGDVSGYPLQDIFFLTFQFYNEQHAILTWGRRGYTPRNIVNKWKNFELYHTIFFSTKITPIPLKPHDNLDHNFNQKCNLWNRIDASYDRN